MVGGTTTAQNLTLKNDGDVASGVPSIALEGANPGQFTIVSNACTAALPAGGSCLVTVAFAPMGAGSAAAALRATASPGGSVSTQLAGTGQAPAALALMPGSVAFGPALIGVTTTAQTLTLTNNGGVASGVPTVGLEGVNPGQFTIVSNACTAALPATGSCLVTVAFSPTVAGATAALIKASATPGGSVTSSLTGTGQAPAALSISQSSYDFGYSDAPAQHVFTITNDGDGASGVPTVGLTESPLHRHLQHLHRTPGRRQQLCRRNHLHGHWYD